MWGEKSGGKKKWGKSGARKVGLRDEWGKEKSGSRNVGLKKWGKEKSGANKK